MMVDQELLCGLQILETGGVFHMEDLLIHLVIVKHVMSVLHIAVEQHGLVLDGELQDIHVVLLAVQPIVAALSPAI